jgi:hypothetical protein
MTSFSILFLVVKIISAGFDVLTAMDMRTSLFWDIKWVFRSKTTDVSEEHPRGLFACYLLHAGFFSFAYPSTLKKEVTFSSETLVEFKRTARHYIPEGRIFQI